MLAKFTLSVFALAFVLISVSAPIYARACSPFNAQDSSKAQEVIALNEQKVASNPDILVFSGIVKSVKIENLRQEVVFIVDEAWYHVDTPEILIETPTPFYLKDGKYFGFGEDSCGGGVYNFVIGRYHTLTFDDKKDQKLLMESGYIPSEFKKKPKDFLPNLSAADFKVWNSSLRDNVNSKYILPYQNVSPWYDFQRIAEEKYDFQAKKPKYDQFDPMEYKVSYNTDLTLENIAWLNPNAPATASLLAYLWQFTSLLRYYLSF